MRKKKTRTQILHQKKLHNFGFVNYNRYHHQIEYTYFEKDDDGNWEKQYGQKTVENEIFVPHLNALIDQLNNKPTQFSKDLFGNSILTGIPCEYFAKDLPTSIRKCPKKFASDINPIIKFLSDEFEFDENVDEVPPLRVHFMDIETIVDNKGFIRSWNVGPDREGNRRGGITLISSYDNIDDHTTVFGINPYTDQKNPLPSNVTYVNCSNERNLIKTYILYLKEKDPDIISGWNCSDYDIPYILNRMILHFGEKSLRHFGNGTAWIKNEAGRFITNKVNIVDYMILYKKFELTPRRSYALAAIVEDENVQIGGEGKIEYEGSIKDFYERDWNGFVRYCIQDAKLVYELDNKKKLMETFVMCCYMAGISFDKAIGLDVSWLRIHDAAIYRFCKEKNVQLPETKNPNDAADKFLGAFVMEPNPGLYDYVTVFDVASLYPSCIQSLNISIEAYRGKVKSGDVLIQTGPFLVEFYSPLWLSLENYAETMIEIYNNYSPEKMNPIQCRPQLVQFNTFEELKVYLTERNYCIGANGTIFTKDFRGVIPSLLDSWIQIRKKNKKLYFEYKQKYQKSKDPQDKALSDRYNTIQKVYKIRLNSLYGFVGAKWSRFYHTDLAEAVTSTGQFVLKTTIEYLKRKNPFFATMYCDTDSIFINYGKILEYKGIEISETNKKECVQACLDIDREIRFAIEENLKNLTENIMLSPNYYKFETEEVISKLLITSKKKYIAKVAYDKTTQQYPQDDFTIKGMEFKKSNLSKPIKKFLKDLTVKIMDGFSKEETIQEIKTMFYKLPNFPIDDISYAQGVRSIWKYERDTNIAIQDKNNALVHFPKKTPYHIAGALVMNALIDHDYDLRSMNKIGEGDKAKIVFVTPTNAFGIKALTIIGTWHPKLYEYFSLDVEYMIHRLILGPMQPVFDAMKYNITLDDVLQFKFLDKDNKYKQLLLF